MILHNGWCACYFFYICLAYNRGLLLPEGRSTMFILIGLWLLFLSHQAGHRRALPYGRRRFHLPVVVHRSQRKPAWVKREVIRFKALIPVAGCRTLVSPWY